MSPEDARLDQESTARDERGPTGIGGWLLVLAVGICLSPLLILKGIGENLHVLSDDTWEAITTPGNPAYHPLFGPLVIAELLVQLTLLVGSVVALVYFFTKSHRFPPFMIALMIGGVAYIAADTVAASLIIPPAYAGRLGEQILEMARVVIPTLIWATYLARSKRVRNTFGGAR
jgi:hypothetical protein